MLNRHSFNGLKAVLAFDNWPMLVFGRVCDRKTALVVYRKNGCDILVDHRGGDQCGTRLCIATDMYRKYLSSFHLSGPARVLDLGANGGGFPLMLRINGVQMARVVCVEMSPLTFQRLQLNLLTNLGPSAVALNSAACAMPEGTEIPIKLTRGGTGERLEDVTCGSAEGCVSIRSTSLMSLMDRYFQNTYVDICKIDIEGAEYELFESAPDSYVQRLKYLLIEMHYYEDSSLAKGRLLMERLAAMGFSDVTMEEPRGKGFQTEVRAFAGPASFTQKSENLH